MKAERKLNRVFGTTMSLLSKLSMFHSVAMEGLSHGSQAMVSDLMAVNEKMYSSGALAKWLLDPSKVDDFVRLMKEQVPSVCNRIENTTQNAVDAASIVFAHSILDACVFGYLTVTSLASPDLWEQYVLKKKIELSDFKNKSYKKVRDEKIQKFLTELERKSLLYKLDLLHNIAPPPAEKISDTYKYDETRLRIFDEARHKIVHGNDWSSYSFGFDTEFRYWNFLNFYLSILVAQRTGLKLSSEWIEGFNPNQRNSHS